MAVVDENARELLRKMTKEDVIKAMDLFDKKLRSSFEDNRWRDYILPYNGNNYPPKDLLRCAIAVIKNTPYDRNSVIGGGSEINKHFEKIGFEVVDTRRKNRSLNLSKVRSSAIKEEYLPNKGDIDLADSQLRESSEEVIDIEDVLDQVEVNFNKAGKPLKDNWREITRRNIEIWFGNHN